MSNRKNLGKKRECIGGLQMSKVSKILRNDGVHKKKRDV